MPFVVPTTPSTGIGFAVGRNATDFSERDRLVFNLCSATTFCRPATTPQR